MDFPWQNVSSPEGIPFHCAACQEIVLLRKFNPRKASGVIHEKMKNHEEPTIITNNHVVASSAYLVATVRGKKYVCGGQIHPIITIQQHPTAGYFNDCFSIPKIMVMSTQYIKCLMSHFEEYKVKNYRCIYNLSIWVFRSLLLAEKSEI